MDKIFTKNQQIKYKQIRMTDQNDPDAPKRPKFDHDESIGAEPDSDLSFSDNAGAFPNRNDVEMVPQNNESVEEMESFSSISHKPEKFNRNLNNEN